MTRIDEIREKTIYQAKQKNYTIFSDLITDSKQKIEFGCENNHKFSSSWNVFKRSVHGLNCKHCMDDSKNTVMLEKIIRIVEDRDAKLISSDYKNEQSTIELLCDSGHKFEINWKKLRDGTWCKDCCANTFKTENKVKMFLEVFFQQEFTKERFEWNINKDRNQLLNPEEIALAKPKKYKKSPLEIDLYNEDLKIAFEYDGEFHYKLNKWEDYQDALYSYANLVRNDYAKTQNCEDRGIKVFKMPVIKYHLTKSFEKFHDIFTEFCSSKGLNIKYTETQLEYMKSMFDKIKSTDNHVENLKQFEKNKKAEIKITEEEQNIFGNIFKNIDQNSTQRLAPGKQSVSLSRAM